MLGGYQILDLRKIDLVISTTQSNITDAYVLSQLLKLRDFIDKDYDFSKPIENQLKPVLIRYRDKKNGEKSEGAMFGELAVVDNYYTFKITGRISGALILTIKVAFQEITNAYGAKEWVINTAKIQLQDVIEDLEGNLALEGDLDVSGDLDIGGDVTVSENSKVKVFENIIDKNGHARFFEIEGEYDTQEGITISYCKASLCGTHLLVVCAGTIADETVLNDNFQFGVFPLPEWIRDKIVAVWGSNIEFTTKNAYALDWSAQSVGFLLQKTTGSKAGVRVIKAGGTSITFTKDRNFRIQFDLLIDNE